jgi:hypothetical protein
MHRGANQTDAFWATVVPFVARLPRDAVELPLRFALEAALEAPAFFLRSSFLDA